MNFSNLLMVVDTITKITNEVHLDWLGKIIQSLIEGCGSIGVGIIVFTLILKLITLPFDIFSRVSTKKNALRMEKMRPELEKLQRQYANNSQLYQKKMQDLYKQNGYSPFAACLPTLLNLVFFIIVIGQFSTYSNYANFEVFCKMSEAYETAVDAYDETNQTEYIIKVKDENGAETKNFNLVYFAERDDEIRSFGFDMTENNKYDATFTYSDKTDNTKLKLLYDELKKGKDGRLAEYAESNVITEEDGNYKINSEKSDEETIQSLCMEIVNSAASDFVQANIKKAGQVAAAEAYRQHDLSFLWVKNIWSQDLPWEHPIKSSFASYNFVTDAGCIASCKSQCAGTSNRINSITEENYQELTAGLEKEKKEPNGYLILVVLSIGAMLLSQIIMNKMNKSQMELSTVDGENGTSAMTQKMMTWMMPVMFGFFSFMYTASFSIYMVVSSVFSLLSTLLINFLVEKGFERQAAKEAHELELKRTGRIKELEESKNNKKKK